MAYINNVRRIIINLEKETYFADSGILTVSHLKT